MYADIHCHPAKVAYDSTFMAQDGLDKLPADPWHIPQSNLQDQILGKRAIAYSQCDLAKSTQARVKLMFAALYPIEKGFFYGKPGGRIDKKIMTEYYRRFHFDGGDLAVDWLTRRLKSQKGLERVKKSDFEFLNNRMTQLPLERVGYIQNGSYDYFEELKLQYKFYLKKAGEKSITYEKLQLEPKGPQQSWQGTYQLARTGSDVLHKLRPDNDDVILVLTIDGIHSLGIGNPEDDIFRGAKEPKDVSIGILKSRIRQLKGEEQLEDREISGWSHRPLYITFAQNFDNTLCGHARSFPASSEHFYDQSKNLNTGILKSASYEVLCELLGLDKTLAPTGSKRILIDVKHMSAAARQDFYKSIVRPFNRKFENCDNKIPVIASHVGYAGVFGLEELISNANKGLETDDFQVNRFKAWNINLCDEDVIEIHQSNGLIGISLDQRLLGYYKRSWVSTLSIPLLEKRTAIKLLAHTVEHFIHIPFEYHLAHPHRIWDVLCLGSGFDGSIDPINRYATVLDMSRLEEDLIQIIRNIKKEYPKRVVDRSPEQLARKICFENAYDFVVENY
ncbi:MAG: hypothetical protein RIB47_13410 [Cyclobacteriaceae bacterium]